MTQKIYQIKTFLCPKCLQSINLKSIKKIITRRKFDFHKEILNEKAVIVNNKKRIFILYDFPFGLLLNYY